MELLSRPAYKPLWVAARRRVEANGLCLDGAPLTLKGLSEKESDAIAGLLGVRRPSAGAPMRVRLAGLDRALRASVVGRGLLDVLVEISGPLSDRRQAKAATETARVQQWDELVSHPAVVDEPRLRGWLDHVRTTGLDRRLARGDAATAMRAALDVVALIGKSDRQFRLPVLAADVTGDAHGLDRGRSVGTLAVHALSWLTERPFPQDAADWRRTWAEAGVACDDLSCDVLVLNLPGWPTEPIRLTLRQVSSWRPPSIGTQVAFACENPAVVAAAADNLGDGTPTMVCVDGMPSTAALVVLDALVGADCTVRYHGDFDWRGLGIAAVLARKIPSVQPWRYGARDYAQAVDRGLGTVSLTGRPTQSPWDDELATVMEAAAVAVCEEQVLDELLGDLTGRPDSHFTNA